jgi:hypothetical protein
MAEVRGDTDGSEPGGNSASAFGEEGADEKQEESRSGTAVEGGGDVGEPSGQQSG